MGPESIMMLDSPVCVLKSNISFHNYCFKSKHFNSVFQAEIEAVNFAEGWALKNNYKINIFTDSQASIETLKSARPSLWLDIQGQLNDRRDVNRKLRVES
ncbi:hypothetical protein AVEN_183885-1 [Araneus ventricosus]|uniref:RNase H type-1 domain-containing protein n=1 Tax=Araneus ventricosus TaxID=182803 RepID=A0A4Y2TQV8_ARAVE|nr:hypothetical protein AVEN_183885-1 [Araneus ventricosus]